MENTFRAHTRASLGTLSTLAIVLVFMGLPCQPAFSQEPVPAADEAVWGLYSRLLGAEKLAERGFRLRWSWAQPGVEIFEEWSQPRSGKIVHHNSITLGSQPGEFQLKASTGKTWTGTRQPDGSIAYIGQGIRKQPYSVVLSADGVYEYWKVDLQKDRIVRTSPAAEYQNLRFTPVAVVASTPTVAGVTQPTAMAPTASAPVPVAAAAHSAPPKAFWGVKLADNAQGPIILEVVPGSVLSKAGLFPGLVITHINDLPMNGVPLKNILSIMSEATVLKLRVTGNLVVAVSRSPDIEPPKLAEGEIPLLSALKQRTPAPPPPPAAATPSYSSSPIVAIARATPDYERDGYSEPPPAPAPSTPSCITVPVARATPDPWRDDDYVLPPPPPPCDSSSTVGIARATPEYDRGDFNDSSRSPDIVGAFQRGFSDAIAQSNARDADAAAGIQEAIRQGETVRQAEEERRRREMEEALERERALASERQAQFEADREAQRQREAAGRQAQEAARLEREALASRAEEATRLEQERLNGLQASNRQSSPAGQPDSRVNSSPKSNCYLVDDYPVEAMGVANSEEAALAQAMARTKGCQVKSQSCDGSRNVVGFKPDGNPIVDGMKWDCRVTYWCGKQREVCESRGPVSSSKQ